MCQTITSYWLACGHATTESPPCFTAIKYDLGISIQYCTLISTFTNLCDSECDACAAISGSEVLTVGPDSPLLWMNNVFRASLEPERQPRIAVVDENVKHAMEREKRAVVGRVRKLPQRGDLVPFDRRERIPGFVAALLPFDIRKDL